MDRTTNQTKPPKALLRLTQHDITGIGIAALGFFMGRVVVFGTVNPVAAAYASAFMGSHAFYAALICTVAGLLTRSGIPHMLIYILTLALMAAANLALRAMHISKKTLLMPALAGGSALVSGLVVALAGGINLYLVLLSILECVLTFAVGLIMQKAIAALSGNVRRGALSNEELISLAILAGAITAGAADIHIGWLSLRYFFCVLLILLMAQSGGASVGAAVGMLLGVLMNVAGFEGMAYPVILSVGGMAAGGLRDVAKPFAALGLAFAGGILCLYFSPGLLSMELLLSAALGGVVFCMLPNRFMAHIFETVNPQAAAATEYVQKVCLLTTHRLQSFSTALRKLSATFGGLTEKKQSLTKKEVNGLIDDVATEACADCPRYTACWETHFLNTYQTTLDLLAVCEADGAVSPVQAPTDFRALCVRRDRFCNAVNHFFALYTASLAWHNKLIESRALVAEQLNGVSHIINTLSRELETELDFKAAFERQIINACNLSKIDVESVLVLQDKAGRYEVTLGRRLYSGDKQVKPLVTLISQLLGRKMAVAEEISAPDASMRRTRLVEMRRFSATNAVAKMAKTGSRASGDSYSFMDLPNGQCLLALSDGMGSGRRAHAESAAAIDLLEEFMEAGFDINTAVGMINSALLLKSGDELFSTLDICSIDLHDGTAEFIKIGASTTFHLHDGEADVIRSWSLPVGIMQAVDADVTRRRLKHGDILVMVTDGVLDADRHGKEKEDWLINALTEQTVHNPQELADRLLAEAESFYEGVIKDDMTILVSRVWEKL